jgi:hypothetical protein
MNILKNLLNIIQLTFSILGSQSLHDDIQCNVKLTDLTLRKLRYHLASE